LQVHSPLGILVGVLSTILCTLKFENLPKYSVYFCLYHRDQWGELQYKFFTCVLCLSQEVDPEILQPNNVELNFAILRLQFIANILKT